MKVSTIGLLSMIVVTGLYYLGFGISLFRRQPVVWPWRRVVVLFGIPLLALIWLSGVERWGISRFTPMIIALQIVMSAGFGLVLLLIWFTFEVQMANVTGPIVLTSLRRALARQGMRYEETPGRDWRDWRRWLLKRGSLQIRFGLPDVDGAILVTVDEWYKTGTLSFWHRRNIMNLDGLMTDFRAALLSQRLEGISWQAKMSVVAGTVMAVVGTAVLWLQLTSP